MVDIFRLCVIVYVCCGLVLLKVVRMWDEILYFLFFVISRIGLYIVLLATRKNFIVIFLVDKFFLVLVLICVVIFLNVL